MRRSPKGIIPWRGRYTNEYFAFLNDCKLQLSALPLRHSNCSFSETPIRLSRRLVSSLSQTSKQPKLKTARWEAIWGAALLRELVPNSGRPGRGSARSVQKIAQEFRMNSTSVHLSERPTSRETPWGYGKDVHWRAGDPAIPIIPVLYQLFRTCQVYNKFMRILKCCFPSSYHNCTFHIAVSNPAPPPRQHRRRRWLLQRYEDDDDYYD